MSVPLSYRAALLGYVVESAGIHHKSLKDMFNNDKTSPFFSLCFDLDLPMIASPNNNFLFLQNKILNLPKLVKLGLVATNDLIGSLLTSWLASFLLNGQRIPDLDDYWEIGIFATALLTMVWLQTGLYREIIRHSGWYTVKSFLSISVIYAILATVIVHLGWRGETNLFHGLLHSTLMFCFLVGSRLGARQLLGVRDRPKTTWNYALIYGAGTAGRQLANNLRIESKYKVVGFVDDDRSLQGRTLDGLKVYSIEKLHTILVRKQIGHVFLAMPSVPKKRKAEISDSLTQFAVQVLTVPDFVELIEGKTTLDDLRSLDIKDLIVREQVPADQSLISHSVADKTVMVTGAGGSIGSELCRQIVRNKPKAVVLVENNERALYEIAEELSQYNNHIAQQDDVPITPVLCSVRDQNRLEQIFLEHSPQVVFHAAAFKHVPLVENNFWEGLENNTVGTLKIAEISLRASVEDFILISTDRAVRPTNIMGATKRLAEMIIQALHAKAIGKTRFSIVRFGNVIGSSGSVIPKFKKQIEAGGPVTVTHAEVTRYFMTIEEAAELVLQASSMAKGGDVFLLDMGKPVKIIDLARRLISLSGLSLKEPNNPDGDIEIQITGLRSGEKLYEEWLIGESSDKTSHEMILRAMEEYIDWEELFPKIQALQNAAKAGDESQFKRLLRLLVNGYHSDKLID